MKPLTQDQIKAVIDWLNTWEQLENTVIPIRFRDEWSKKLNLIDKNNNIRPPIGLKPKFIHDQERQIAIIDAINRYLEAGKSPPKEWVLEFASYCD